LAGKVDFGILFLNILSTTHQKVIVYLIQFRLDQCAIKNCGSYYGALACLGLIQKSF